MCRYTDKSTGLRSIDAQLMVSVDPRYVLKFFLSLMESTVLQLTCGPSAGYRKFKEPVTLSNPNSYIKRKLFS